MRRRSSGILTAAFLFLIAFAAAAPGRAADLAPTVDSAEVLERNLYKTITYEVLTNGFDAAMYGLVLGGSAAGAPLFIAANATLAAASYYAHETAWDLGFSEPEPFGGWTLAVRTATYRVVSSSKTYGLALLFTGDPVAATGFAVVGAVADVTVYLVNDWAWNRYWPLTRPTEPPPRTVLIRG